MTPDPSRLRVTLPICYRCRKEAGMRGDGLTPCPVDGVGVVKHGEEMYCPKGRFPFGNLGRWTAAFFWHAGVTSAYVRVRRWLNYDAACGSCASRARRLDSFGARVGREWRRFLSRVRGVKRHGV